MLLISLTHELSCEKDRFESSFLKKLAGLIGAEKKALFKEKEGSVSENVAFAKRCKTAKGKDILTVLSDKKFSQEPVDSYIARLEKTAQKSALEKKLENWKETNVSSLTSKQFNELKPLLTTHKSEIAQALMAPGRITKSSDASLNILTGVYTLAINASQLSEKDRGEIRAYVYGTYLQQIITAWQENYLKWFDKNNFARLNDFFSWILKHKTQDLPKIMTPEIKAALETEPLKTRYTFAGSLKKTIDDIIKKIK